MKRFELHIDLGNAEMQTEHHIAEALDTVAREVETGRRSGPIYDINGNTVGRYEYGDV